jgi:hypothetical protein
MLTKNELLAIRNHHCFPSLVKHLEELIDEARIDLENINCTSEGMRVKQGIILGYRKMLESFNSGPELFDAIDQLNPQETTSDPEKGLIA